MLDFLRIRNHQSHKDTLLEFVPGVNVITPRVESDTRNNIGKTAILRALRLATDNRPLGGRFFSNFAGRKGTTEIDLGVDGRRISLAKDVVVKDGKKTVKRSGYSIDGEECSGDYGALKGGIPDRIKSLLNLSSLNVQEQLDGPFLICSSPGEVAREFNKVTRLENADKWALGFTTRINTANQEVSILEGQLEGQRKEMEEYGDLPDIERVVQRAERIQREMDACESSRARVKDTLDGLAVIDGEMVGHRRVVKAGALVEECGRLLASLRKKEQDIRSVRNQIERLQTVEDEMFDYREVAKAGDLVEKCVVLLDGMEERERDIRSVQGSIDKLQAVEALLVRYRGQSRAGPLVEKARALCYSMEEKTKEINEMNMDIWRLEKLDVAMRASERDREESMRGYVSVLKELKRCPTCFTEVDADTLDRIVEEMQG